MIRELKTLVAVAREGTFAAAGQKVGLTQAAVSAQMQRLEGELGFELFDRTGRAAKLNPMGQQTLAQAEELIRLLVPRHVDGDDWAELIASQPFVRYDRASFGGRQVDRFLRAAHLSVQQVCEADELDAIVRLVANGVGVALVPQTATHRR